MDTVTAVLPRDGYYLVGIRSFGQLRTERVDKQKRCSCGGSASDPCIHIEAVACYLKLGGQRAAEVPSLTLPATCPICGSPVVPGYRKQWRCTQSPAHYWQWLGESTGVKAFLTQPHPAKQGEFYTQSQEERAAFLEGAQRLMARNGYSPYVTQEVHDGSGD